MAAGVLMPMIQTVILLLFPREKRGAAMGAIGIVMAFAPAIGPTLSGWIVDVWGWNSIFLLIVPLAVIIIVISFLLLKNVGEISRTRLDVLSVIFSTIGFGGLLYGFSVAGSYGWLHPVTIVSLVVGAVFLAVFIRRQRILSAPLLELSILTIREFRYSTIIGMIVNAALIAGTIITPIYLQNILPFHSHGVWSGHAPRLPADGHYEPCDRMALRQIRPERCFRHRPRPRQSLHRPLRFHR